MRCTVTVMITGSAPHSDDAHSMPTFYKPAVVHYCNLTYYSTPYTARVRVVTDTDGLMVPFHYLYWLSCTRHVSRELVE